MTSLSHSLKHIQFSVASWLVRFVSIYLRGIDYVQRLSYLSNSPSVRKKTFTCTRSHTHTYEQEQEHEHEHIHLWDDGLRK